MRYRKSCVTGAGVSGSICDGSGNAATTIDSGLSEAAVVSVAVPVTGSAAVATSALAALAATALATTALATTALAATALAIAALPIGIACGSSATLALAARDAARFSIGAAPVFSVSAEPKPASQPPITPARTGEPQNAGASVLNRRGVMIPGPPKAPPSHSGYPGVGRVA